MANKKKNSSDYLLDTSREYSIYVCESRAIPKVADGLKDAQRKALWLIRTKGEKIKTVSLAGEMISSGLYLHGDASAGGAISMLAAPYCNNVPLLEGIGSFGTRVAPVEGIGAPRYTYVKKYRATEKLMFQDLDLVPLRDNYDGSTKEPVHFLPLIPTVLLNGVSGIAVGWSTEILPRNLKSLVEATIDALDGKKIKKLIPDYQYLTCRVNHLEGNAWEFSGRVEIVDSSTLKVTELPPDLNLEKFKERLNSMEDDNKINSYVDRSTKVIDITIKMARGSIKDWTEEKAIDFLKLKQRKSERIVVIDWNNNSIRQYESAEDVVKDFVAWRLGWYEARYQRLLQLDETELLYWRALKACFDGKLPQRLIGHKSKQEIADDVKKLVTKAKVAASEDQIDKIVSLPTFRWAQDYYDEVLKRIADLEANCAEYRDILNSPERRREIYRNELMELKKL